MIVNYIQCMCDVVARVLDWESGDPSSSPHSPMETHWVTLGQSQTVSTIYLTGLLYLLASPELMAFFWGEPE